MDSDFGWQCGSCTNATESHIKGNNENKTTHLINDKIGCKNRDLFLCRGEICDAAACCLGECLDDSLWCFGDLGCGDLFKGDGELCFIGD